MMMQVAVDFDDVIAERPLVKYAVNDERKQLDLKDKRTPTFLKVRAVRVEFEIEVISGRGVGGGERELGSRGGRPAPEAEFLFEAANEFADHGLVVEGATWVVCPDFEVE